MHVSVVFIVALVASCFTPGVVARCRSLGARAGCPSRWRQWGNSCYLRPSNGVEWSKARKKCERLGGVLAAPRSVEEENFIKTLVVGIERAWIDCNDQAVEGTWECKEGGVEVSYTNWYPGQPNEFGGLSEDCAAFDTDGYHDFPCDREFPVVCKRHT